MCEGPGEKGRGEREDIEEGQLWRGEGGGATVGLLLPAVADPEVGGGGP